VPSFLCLVQGRQSLWTSNSATSHHVWDQVVKITNFHTMYSATNRFKQSLYGLLAILDAKSIHFQSHIHVCNQHVLSYSRTRENYLPNPFLSGSSQHMMPGIYDRLNGDSSHHLKLSWLPLNDKCLCKFLGFELLVTWISRAISKKLLKNIAKCLSGDLCIK